jgi:hypothetical protein
MSNHLKSFVYNPKSINPASIPYTSILPNNYNASIVHPAAIIPTHYYKKSYISPSYSYQLTSTIYDLPLSYSSHHNKNC